MFRLFRPFVMLDQEGKVYGNNPVTGLYRLCYNFGSGYVSRHIRIDLQGIENLPKDGSFIVCPNHISEVDPLSLGFLFAANGLELRFLAKDSLFRLPVVSFFMRHWRMIPVGNATDQKNSKQLKKNSNPLKSAIEALEQGGIIGIYVEGTLSRDPAFWPGRARSGAARLALDSGAKVYPIAQWGAHHLTERYIMGITFRGRPTLHVRILPAVDLSDLTQSSADHASVNEATNRIRRAIVDELEKLRGQTAPPQVWNYHEMGGLSKKQLVRLSKWRKKLARSLNRLEILPVDLSD